jgi:HK97 family phage prohead protease
MNESEQRQAAVEAAMDDRAAALDTEQRQSYLDLRRNLSAAVCNQPTTGGYLDAYLSDFDEDSVIYYSGDKMFSAPYKIKSDGTVKLGDPQEVEVKTSYQPVQSNSATQGDAERRGDADTAEAPEGPETAAETPESPDQGEREPADLGSRNFPTPKRAFSTLMERPPATAGGLTVRMSTGEADKMTANFDGYAYTINERYGVTDWLGEYEERIGPGAASKTLREQVIPLLLNHDGLPIASTASGTSELADDGKGLRNRAQFDRRSARVNDVCIAMERGDVDKMSFSFRAIAEDWNKAYDDRLVREMQMFDTSIVTYPANPNTSAQLVDEVRSALGREGRSLWLSNTDLSVRSALPVLTRGDSVELDEDSADLLERAVRALVHADEVMVSRHGHHGRARTFVVVKDLLNLRAGKMLSKENTNLLNDALTALGSAQESHAAATEAHAAAGGKVAAVLEAAGAAPAGHATGSKVKSKAKSPTTGKTPKSGKTQQSKGDGKSDGTPPGGQNPINPTDGAGPRSATQKLAAKRRREAEIEAFGRRR